MENQINIKLKEVRAIKKANIILDGITVISGENGCGKSTISKLTYNLLKTSIEFDQIIDKKLNSELKYIYRTLDQLTRDLSYFLENDEYNKVRSSFRRLYRNNTQLNLFEEDNSIIIAIDYLIDLFSEISIVKNKSQLLSRRFDRMKKILIDSIYSEKLEEDLKIPELLSGLKTKVNNSIRKANKLKETRPVSILNETLDEAFSDAPLAKSFNLYEYNIPIIDRKNKKLIPIHTIQNVAYIDTPMIIGLEFYGERSHWDDINRILLNKSINRSNNEIDLIFREIVLKGEVNIEEKEISDQTFLYRRNDGEEFDLLECATGLKSFAILQMLYKNGFLSNKTLLIIDEPEVHLHPQWVVEYARLIVLLNKNNGVRFLIASHHPDMISAIKYISEKEQVNSDLHFYLANRIQNTFSYEYVDLGVEIEEIFSSFNIALKGLICMEQKNSWKYCGNTTIQHPLAVKFNSCIEDIDTVSITEGARNSPFSNEICINLDKVEKSLAQKEKREARKTMDISFGIKSGNQKRVLLCEYRLNYKNVNNLKKSELDSKILNSKTLLGQTPMIHDYYLFIFSVNLKNQAYHYLRKLYSNKRIIEVLDLADLKYKYFE